MPEFELLAGQCDPNPNCPKVVRIGPDELVVVGVAGADNAVVTIGAALFRAALTRLSSVPSAVRETGAVSVNGTPVTVPAELVAFGVGPGEAAVRIPETAFRALASVGRAA